MSRMNCSPAKMEVLLRDQHTEIIDLYLHKPIQVMAIEVDSAIDDVVVTVSATTEPSNGNLVCLKEDRAYYQGCIISHSANGSNWDITLDTPLDFAFTTDARISEATHNMAVDGSVTPEIFHIGAGHLESGVEWDVVGIAGEIIDTTAMDDGGFGGISALTNGIVIRCKDGITKNIFNARTNGELGLRSHYKEYSPKPKTGQYGFIFRKVFAGQGNHGVAVRLKADDFDSIQCIIQDDLTDLISFKLVIQGHYCN
jgi:hypothetical protein